MPRRPGEKKSRAELRQETDEDLVHHTKRLARTDHGGKEARATMVKKMKKAKFHRMSPDEQADFIREQQNERAKGIRKAQGERFDEILERLQSRQPAQQTHQAASQPGPN